MNKFQNAVKKAYAGGEFGHVTSVDEAKQCGDSLFSFLMIELSDDEGCENLADAVGRTKNALEDVREALHSLMELGSEYEGELYMPAPEPSKTAEIAKQLISEAEELKEMKFEINGDYSPEDMKEMDDWIKMAKYHFNFIGPWLAEIEDAAIQQAIDGNSWSKR